ncbi:MULTISPECIES: hypothetical protein [unclassified Rhodococcus (in: high G+C Gram-positive bacteria)]|uniref:hypothetical protein n=1 Tax=unclassified Rhodococcus (in: high G+C Gram-positive bacteria) TaxID=192944 RepID=UPI00163A26D3|nr:MULTISPECIES: hypothetical protein [unclassified Rhodococcus (in: high G+C Gram-positive bacteria)]MBC2639964.1 hypothetical protein [Rhodococcus sp. 3A]MBC2895289.1 hypothetical protein [Rhodococcus sp. 4CII]
MTLAAPTPFRTRSARHAKNQQEEPDRRFSLGTGLVAALLAAVPAMTVSGSVILAAATAVSVLAGVVLAAFLISSLI